MVRENYFGGEAFENVSPHLSDDQQAVEYASFGQFGYGGPMDTIYPGSAGYQQPQPNMGGYMGYQQPQPNMAYQQPYFQQPQMGYGYMPNQYQGYMPPFNTFMNPPQYGLGMPPQQSQGGVKSAIGSINPAFDYMSQNPQYFGGAPYMQPQDVTYDIPPISISGSEFLPPMDFEEQLENMQLEYWQEVQDEKGRRAAQRHRSNDRFSGADQFGYNYYNSLYYNNYTYNDTLSIDRKYKNMLSDMQENAKQRRIDLNIHLAKLAFNYLGQEYDEQALVEAYTGKTVTVPGITTLDLYKQQRFNNLVPFDNSGWYRQKDAAVSDEFHKFVHKTDNMEQFFENIGLYEADQALKAEEHRRRAYLKDSYDSNVYNTIVRAKSMEREAAKHGIALNPNDRFNQLMGEFEDLKKDALNLDNYPVLKQCAHIADDGTLHISYNYQPPEHVESNYNESKYQQEKAQFRDFLGSIKNIASVDEDPNL